MKTWKTIPFTTAFLAAQAAMSSAFLPRFDLTASAEARPAPGYRYRVTMVPGSAAAINYKSLKHSTVIDMLGTSLVTNASGEADLKNEGGKIRISAKFKNLPPASSFGGEVLTYVLWAISPEGNATNLGEILLDHGHGKLQVTEQLRSFALVVTAEPYFAVTQPSDVVVMVNALRKGSVEHFEIVDAKYQLLKRGQYTLNLDSMAPIVMDGGTPFAVYQARNAVRIARATGASAYAPEAFAKAGNYLAQAESRESGSKARTMAAREAVQRAEDARLIAVQKQDGERLAMERQAAQDTLAASKRETALASAAEDAALLKSRQAEDENTGLRSRNEGLKTRNDGLKARNEGLRTRLMDQLNVVLQTRATARGLIVSMSDVLFENGKAVLMPGAREMLAKIAGILSTHPGLKIEAEGFTDSNGGEDYNQRLSEQRASNARDYLLQQGVSADSITFKGFGEANPVATNATAEGRQLNRRVELVVSGEGLTEIKSAGI